MLNYWMTSPFVDAYCQGEEKISRKEFDRKMRCQANQWGSMGLWYGMKKTEGIPKDVVGRPVLAIGFLRMKRYAAVYKKTAQESLEIVECQGWPDDWNVT